LSQEEYRQFFLSHSLCLLSFLFFLSKNDADRSVRCF